MLILEGAGRLGKSTAAHKIVEIVQAAGLDAEYRHMGRPASGFDFCHGYVPNMASHYVQDRFHLGAIAWHRFDETGMTANRMAVLQGLVHSMGGMVVIFYSSNHDWYKSHWEETRRAQETFDVKPHVNANVEFGKIARSGWKGVLTPDWVIDVSKGNFASDRTLERIAEMWITRRKIAKGLQHEFLKHCSMD